MKYGQYEANFSMASLHVFKTSTEEIRNLIPPLPKKIGIYIYCDLPVRLFDKDKHNNISARRCFNCFTHNFLDSLQKGKMKIFLTIKKCSKRGSGLQASRHKKS